MGLRVICPSPVVSQVWRDGSRQDLLATLVQSIDVVAPTLATAKTAGVLCGKSSTSDVVDALVMVMMTDGDTVLTSDPNDLRHLAKTSQRKIIISPV